MNAHPDCPKHKTGAGPCYCGKTPSNVVAEPSLEPNKNPILSWSWQKPTEPGLYLVCRGDVETQENISPFRLVDQEETFLGSMKGSWPCFRPEHVSQWHNSLKFARICIGKEALDG